MESGLQIATALGGGKIDEEDDFLSGESNVNGPQRVDESSEFEVDQMVINIDVDIDDGANRQFNGFLDAQ